MGVWAKCGAACWRMFLNGVLLYACVILTLFTIQHNTIQYILRDLHPSQSKTCEPTNRSWGLSLHWFQSRLSWKSKLPQRYRQFRQLDQGSNPRPPRFNLKLRLRDSPRPSKPEGLQRPRAGGCTAGPARNVVSYRVSDTLTVSRRKKQQTPPGFTACTCSGQRPLGVLGRN